MMMNAREAHFHNFRAARPYFVGLDADACKVMKARMRTPILHMLHELIVHISAEIAAEMDRVNGPLDFRPCAMTSDGAFVQCGWRR